MCSFDFRGKTTQGHSSYVVSLISVTKASLWDSFASRDDNETRRVLDPASYHCFPKQTTAPKPKLAADGSVYFVHEETGESRWTFPVRRG